MKKKLEETYLPDKEARKKRLVVGLSGGLNSYVTAYLLKIQKYELIGVTIQMSWDNEAESANVLSCHMDQTNLDKVREFCHQLGIPHFVVKASDEFKEEVIENWVASRISGTKTNHCWNCHDLRMKLLHKKMQELEAVGLATGHLGKLFRQESHHSVYVHTSNDEVFDQSALLSRLPHEILDKLMLPLSDLQQKEINKLAENFGLSTTPKKIKMHECLDIEHITDPYLDSHVPKKYKQPGELVDSEKTVIGDHQGVLMHAYGENYQIPHQRQNDVFKFVKYSVQDKRIEVARPDYFKRKKFFLNQCRISEETPWFEPLKGVIKISETEFAECWIYPKNLSSAVIEMDEPHSIIEGDVITVLKKKGKNAKVYLTGKARYVVEDHVDPEEGKERAKADYSRDF